MPQHQKSTSPRIKRKLCVRGPPWQALLSPGHLQPRLKASGRKKGRKGGREGKGEKSRAVGFTHHVVEIRRRE